MFVKYQVLFAEKRTETKDRCSGAAVWRNHDLCIETLSTYLNFRFWSRLQKLKDVIVGFPRESYGMIYDGLRCFLCFYCPLWRDFVQHADKSLAQKFYGDNKIFTENIQYFRVE